MRQIITVIICFLVIPTALAKRPELAKKSNIVINLNGVDGAVAKNIMNSLQNKQNLIPHPLTQSRINNFYREAPKVIKTAMKPYGYFRPRIQSRLQYNDQQWTTTFTIQPGQAMPITKISVIVDGAGANDKAYLDYLNKLPLKKGDTLDIEKYDSIKHSLFDLASARGYFRAKMLKSKITINLYNYTASIVIHFYTGPRFRFGKTFFSDTPFNLKFLRRFLTYHQGEPYDYTKIQRTQKGLRDSNYFTQVIINPMPEKIKNGEVPIQVHLIMRKSKQYIIGIGFGTDTGVRGTLGITNTYVNQWGHRFQSLLQASGKNSILTASYIIPGRKPATNYYTLSAGLGRLRLNSGNANTARAAASYTSVYGRLKQVISMNYVNERYNIRNLPRTRANLIYPNIHWSYLIADRKQKPRFGISFHLNLAGTISALSSKSGFSQVRGGFRSLLTIPYTYTRFLIRSELGRTGINSINNLPLTLQLLAGGIQSIRGFRFNDIGPGRNLFVSSGEIQQRVYGDWYLAGFIDFGNVANTTPFQNFNVGVGPAIAWLSPVGMIEVGMAKPIAVSVPGTSKKWRFFFSIGPEL